ncbi:hypothetical protein PP713_03435 [Mycobacterium sp. CSUR Q5927]|nr:hypothetical protein [Mycobacterium sp. CSUR Q5927]
MQHDSRHEARYGLSSLVAAAITVAIFEAVTWAWFPYFLVELLAFAVASAVALPMGLFMSQLGGTAAQAGRGILIGYLATPLTIALTGIPTLIVTQLLHLA